jgi:putative methyltransferase (TIGR04325 family)
MSSLAKKIAKLYRRLRTSGYGWHGNYASWQEALQHCTGYSDFTILQKVRAATLKVKSGEAAFEKDSMLFDKVEYSWPLLSNLLSIALHNNKHVSVVDFGGSLGSTYFQNRKYLDDLDEVKWSVVEQKEFVTTGQKEIADSKLQFFYNIDESLKARGPHDLLLISCVLPYLEKPYDFLSEIQQKKFSYIIIENTYFNPKQGNRLTVQKVPPVFYSASYPAWFLDYEKVKESLQKNYAIVQEYLNNDFIYLDGEKVIYRGLVLKLKS